MAAWPDPDIVLISLVTSVRDSFNDDCRIGVQRKVPMWIGEAVFETSIQSHGVKNSYAK